MSATCKTERLGHGIPVDALLQSNSISAETKARITKADANTDGILSVEELVEVMKSEQAAVQQQRLFRRLLVFMSLLMLLTVAALVGSVYAIVDLQEQVKEDQNVLLSKDSEEVMAVETAKAFSTDFSSLLGTDGIDAAVGLERLILPGDDASKFTVYTVTKVDVGQPESGATIHTASGERFEIDSSGELFMVNATASNSMDQGGVGRRLMAVGTVGGPSPAMTSDGRVTHTKYGDIKAMRKREEMCNKYIAEFQKKYEARKKKKGSGEDSMKYPPDFPKECYMRMIMR